MKGRESEAERQQLVSGDAAVDEKIAAGDADVKVTRPDVDGDVTGPEKEKLHIVLAVSDDKFRRFSLRPVAGVDEQLTGCRGQCPFVGHC